MKNHYNCIYMYTNKINGKRYIGQAKDFNKRHRNHCAKCFNETPIDKAFNKYGEENFEIIILKEDLKNKCLMNLWEYYYIKKFNTLICNSSGYNIADGGQGGYLLCGKTDEEKKEIFKKISKSRIERGVGKGEKNPFYGKKHTEEDLQKMRKPCSEETKKKIGEANKGKQSYWKNKNLPEETKNKISKTRKEKELSKGKNNPKAKRVAQYDKEGNLIKIWDCAKDVSEELGINYSTLRMWLQGRNKQTSNFIFKYHNFEIE